MPIFQVTSTELKPVSETTFGAEGIMERKDIQRMLREPPHGASSPPTSVCATCRRRPLNTQLQCQKRLSATIQLEYMTITLKIKLA